MEYIKHLSKDKLLAKAIKPHAPFKLKKRKNVFLHLCASIVSQQLSTTVAKVIQDRFLSIYEGKDPTPEQVLGTSLEQLRAIGLSNAKAGYVQNIARFAIEFGLDPVKLNKMSNDELMDYLIQIKGVGRWTVEMQLMFTLGREDVFAIDDLGIQQAMIAIYQLKTTDKKKMREKMLNISTQWSPYRTYACLHLWHWKDSKKKKS